MTTIIGTTTNSIIPFYFLPGHSFIANHKPFVMKKKPSLLAILFAIIAFVGCKKEVEDPELYTDPSTLVSVSQFGWLQFNDAAHALSIVDQLIQEDSVYEANNDSWMGAIDTSLTQGQIDSIFAYNNYQPDYTYLSFENSHSGFVSLRQQYDYLEDVYLSSQQLNSTLDNIPNHALNFRGLNSVTNSKGECQIGDYVFFTKPDGFCFFVHADSISASNISDLRGLSASNYSNGVILDSIYSPTELANFNQEYTGGDVVYLVEPISVTIGMSLIPAYIAYNIWQFLDPAYDPGENCRFRNEKYDQYTISSTEKLKLKTNFGPTFIGHWSSSDIDHVEYINNKWKKTRATIGVKTICPYLNASDDCDNGLTLWRNIPKNCSNMWDLSCYRSSWSKHEGHTNYLGAANSKKIHNNTRHTYFYYNRNVISTLYNVW